MAEFRVRWEIDIEADTAIEAAAKAFTMQQDPTSTATVFEVAKVEPYRSIMWETIDLLGKKVERDRHDH